MLNFDDIHMSNMKKNQSLKEIYQKEMHRDFCFSWTRKLTTSLRLQYNYLIAELGFYVGVLRLIEPHLWVPQSLDLKLLKAFLQLLLALQVTYPDIITNNMLSILYASLWYDISKYLYSTMFYLVNIPKSTFTQFICEREVVCGHSQYPKIKQG